MSIGLRIGKGKQMLHRTLKLSLVLCCAMIIARQGTAQTTSPISAEPGARGIYSWIQSNAHGELTFPLYCDYRASFCAQTNDAHRCRGWAAATDACVH